MAIDLGLCPVVGDCPMDGIDRLLCHNRVRYPEVIAYRRQESVLLPQFA